MAGNPHPPDGTGTGATCPELGLRRVSGVLIVVGAGGPRCQVVGLGHRLPVRRSVPLSTASALIAAGVPYSVRTAGAPAPAPTGTGQAAPARGERV